MLVKIVGKNVKVANIADKAAVDAAIVGVADPVQECWVSDRQGAQQNALD